MGTIIWDAIHEVGDKTEWQERQFSDCDVSTAPATAAISAEAAHYGANSVKLYGPNIDVNQRAARFNRIVEFTEGYFSAWFMFPTTVPLPDHTVDSWLMIMQIFKGQSGESPSPEFVIYVKNDSGTARLVLRRLGGGLPWSQQTEYSPIVTPPAILANKWFKIQIYVRDGVTNGILNVWQNHILCWNQEGLDTRGAGTKAGMGVAGYGYGISNITNLTLYADKCAAITVP